MIAPQGHLYVQRDRVADLHRQARRHPLADVAPADRRAPLGRLRRLFASAPAASASPSRP